MIQVHIGKVVVFVDADNCILAVVTSQIIESHHLTRGKALNLMVNRPSLDTDNRVDGYFQPLEYMLGDNALSFPLKK